jgi:long-chain acyl-CoA synthetase
MRAAGPAPVAAPIQPETDVAGLIYTGGTTGISKGAMLSHRNMVTNAMQASAYCSWSRAPRLCSAAPYFHSFRQCSR